jgi:hypothetical protein
MGGCGSSPQDKDQEVDLYMQKHHKVRHITTDKNQYEISKQ